MQPITQGGLDPNLNDIRHFRADQGFDGVVDCFGLISGWPRLFHSMRDSRQTELQHEFPLHVVCSWLGNSPRIAQQSYLLVTEDDFSKASGRALSCNFLSVALRKYITTLPIFFFPLGCRVRNHTKEESMRILGKPNMQTDKLDG